MSEDQPEDAYELVMPFVACASNGGPYDDDAFTAGYVAGGLDKTLGAIAALEGHGMVGVSVRTNLLPQLDLIAMRHGFTVETEAIEGMAEWTSWTATRA